MGIASIILGVLSMIFAVAGFLLSWVPALGALLSFGAPVLALIGIVLGGVGMSRAKEEGGETGVPMAGMIVSIVCFFPALLVALTCGVCNTMCTTAGLTSPRNHGSQGAPWTFDASAPSPGLGSQPAQPLGPPQPANPAQPTQLPDPGVMPANPSVPTAVPGQPPPAFPPPPPPDPVPL